MKIRFTTIFQIVLSIVMICAYVVFLGIFWKNAPTLVPAFEDQILKDVVHYSVRLIVSVSFIALLGSFYCIYKGTSELQKKLFWILCLPVLLGVPHLVIFTLATYKCIVSIGGPNDCGNSGLIVLLLPIPVIYIVGVSIFCKILGMLLDKLIQMRAAQNSSPPDLIPEDQTTPS